MLLISNNFFFFCEFYVLFISCLLLFQMNTSLGRWVLEPLMVYHPHSGVTTNQSESFNSTLKRLQRWREVPVDTIVLTLYHLQAFLIMKTERTSR